MTIPKLLWQTWKHCHPPKPLKRLIGSFRRLNPNWKHNLCTDLDIEEFIRSEFPHLAETISRYPKGVYVADIWRCLILYRHGGIYSDIDVECIRPLDELLEEIHSSGVATADTEILLSRDHPIHESLHFKGREMFMNFFMIASPESQFIRLYLDRLERLACNGFDHLAADPVALTGPGAFSDIIEEAGGPRNVGVGVIPWEWVSPIPDMAIRRNFPSKRKYDEMIRSGDWAQELNPFVAHYWWHSYFDENSTITKYGSILFQSDGMIVSRRLEKLIPPDDYCGYVAGRALAEFAELESRAFLSYSRTGLDFPSLASSALADVEYTGYSTSAPPSSGLSLGLLHISSEEEGATERLNDALSRHTIVPNGLLYVSGERSTTREAIKQIALTRDFSLLEDDGGLLLRAPDPNSRIFIPKIIHQTWKSRDIPPTFRDEWIDSWLRLNGPNGWRYRFWTDEDLMEFVAQEFPDFVDCYCDYDHHIKRVDAARYLILKRLGGLYVDMDFACLKPFDDLLLGKRLLFGTEFDEPHLHCDSACNALMASVPDHPFWNGIEVDLRVHANNEVLSATGPRFLGKRLRDSLRFLPEADTPCLAQRDVFYPFSWDSMSKEGARISPLADLAKLYPESYAVTFWTGTWL